MNKNSNHDHPENSISEAIREEILDEIADLEEYAKRGARPPRCRGYRIRINGERYEVHQQIITGREVLQLAGLVPPERYILRVKKAGHPPEKVDLDEPVDLRTPGVEKFKALPNDQTDGLELRRDFQLPPEDVQFLEDYGLPWETISDGSLWVLIHEFRTPGYNHEKATAAIRIETGYPHAALDMVYFYPPLARQDGRPINATEGTQSIGGKSYQRWSRHRTPQNPWVVGQDNLGSHIILIEDWLAREFKK